MIKNGELWNNIMSQFLSRIYLWPLWMVTIMIVAPSLCNTHCGVTRRKPATVVLAIVLYMKKQLTKKKASNWDKLIMQESGNEINQLGPRV